MLLVPRDPADDKDAILEVKSGEGGEESALFAGDLLRMYSRYAEQRGWKVEVLDATESDLGGYKSVTLAVKAKGTPEPGEAPYGLLKFEGGVHRVQRVPVTESQGRVHTSAAGVLVLPEAEQVDVDDRRERPAHRRLPQQRPGRPERQHHRLRGPDHPRADRASWSAARTRRASSRTRSRRCASCGPGCWPRPRRRPTPPPATRAAARSAPSTAPSGSAPTTSRRTASPTTAPATRPTTSTRCSTATSSRSSTPASQMDLADRLAALDAVTPTRSWPRPRRPAARGRRAQPRARRRRAARPRARHRPVPAAAGRRGAGRARWSGTTPSWPAGRPASRSST